MKLSDLFGGASPQVRAAAQAEHKMLMAGVQKRLDAKARADARQAERDAGIRTGKAQ